MDKKSVAGWGAILAAGVGSICCVGPVIFASLGAGAGTLAFLREFGVLHTPMMVLALLFLATAIYLQIKKGRKSAAKEDCCASDRAGVFSEGRFIWIAAFLTVILFLFPYINSFLF